MTAGPLAAALAGLAPADLVELTERAALLTRVDRKYVLPLADARLLLADLAATGAARVLEIDGARLFRYASVYFDTPDLTSYHLAAHRRPVRWKVRTRTYLDAGQCWLEVKTRDRRGRTVKHRHGYDPADGAALTGEGAGFVDAVLGGLGVPQPPTAALVPTLVTRYGRSTLLLPDDDSRVTVDTGLVCAGGDGGRGDGPVLHLPDGVVVETKTLGRPSAADRLLWALGHRPVAVSKFATGLAALHPELPATRWRPVLRRHFAVPPPGTPSPSCTTPRTTDPTWSTS
ncbi:polyphosphate polymerase domain-containing protein [Cellulomonas endophytica]|uniref:polyphosphate polymerase domain-containing protein n=1 Tax=Cellulomonas endophytica TaxID=2494735 RepID=UPI001012688C|nr:polyphosphate polymerase domain-containing protein [Cellulomonas endophytica]